MPDADLQTFVNRLLAALPPVLARAREVVTAAERVPQLEQELANVRAEKGVVESDTAAKLGPLGDTLDELGRILWPEAEANPDVTPVTAIEDAAPVLNGDLDPGAVDGRSDAPAADASTGDGGVAEQGDVETQS